MFDAFRIPKRYQKWENYTLCFSDFSIKDLKERVKADSSLEIVCGECDKPTVVSMDQVLATKSLDHWQINSFFKDWVCPHCAICDLDRHCRRLRISGHYNLFSMGDFQCGGDSH